MIYIIYMLYIIYELKLTGLRPVQLALVDHFRVDLGQLLVLPIGIQFAQFQRGRQQQHIRLKGNAEN